MNIKLLFVLLSFIFGVLGIALLRSFDIYEKEPFWKMFFLGLFGGFVSIITSLLFYAFTNVVYPVALENSLGALFIIGPVEEFAKLFALFAGFFIIKKEMNEPIDGIIYISCVALGFSLIENYTYAIAYQNMNYLILTRLLITTPAHIMFSAVMGIAFYYYKKININYLFVLLAFLYASLLHGVYDLIIFNSFPFLVFLIFFIILRQNIVFFLNYTMAVSPFRKNLKQFLEGYKEPVLKNGLECLSCGSVNKKLSYSIGKINIQKCDSCEHYVVSLKDLFHIFRYFGANIFSLRKKYVDVAKTPPLYAFYSGNTLSKEKKLAFFEIEVLNTQLESMISKTITNFRSKWWYKKFFYRQGDDALLPYDNV